MRPENIKKANTKGVPPYIGWSTWNRLLDRMKTFIPPRLDRSYFDSLGFSNTQYSQAMRALSFFGLVDETRKPVEKLRRLVMGTTEERKVILRSVIEAGYKAFFDAPGPQNATFGDLESFMRSCGAKGVVGKCATFFLSAAREVGIPLSPQLAAEFRRREGRRVKGPGKESKRRELATKLSRQLTVDSFSLNGIDPKLISYVAELPEEKQDRWIRAYLKIKKALTSG